MRYEDYMGTEFVSLIEKFRNQIGIYVQFTKTDLGYSKSFNQKTEHGDPNGHYAYPIEYVANHPSDINYGSNMPFARILKDKSANKLNLSFDSLDDAKKILYRNGYTEKELTDFIHKVSQGYYEMRANKKNLGGRIVYSFIKFNQDILSGNGQRLAWIRMGYDAIEDTSKRREDSVINKSEPEQICFLTEDSFDVLENIAIPGNQEYQGRYYSLLPKIIEAFVIAFNDEIVDSYNSFSYTKKGEIQLTLKNKDKNYDENRPYRKFRYSNFYGIRLEYIFGDFVIDEEMHYDERIADFVSRISKKYKA